MHHRPIFAPSHPCEVQLSATAISTNAESGAVARDFGLINARSHQPPHFRTLPRWHVAYVHPALPPVHHPWPRTSPA
jgi:hypothetical protein